MKLEAASWSARTEMKEYVHRSGQGLQWSDLSDLKSSVLSREEACYQPLSVSVYTQSTLSGEVLIASGKISLRKAALSIEKAIELFVKLKDHRGRSAGDITLTCILHEAIDSSTLSAMGNEAANMQGLGSIRIHSMALKDLKISTWSMTSKPKIYFQFSLEDKFKEYIYPENQDTSKSKAISCVYPVNLRLPEYSPIAISSMALDVQILCKNAIGIESVLGSGTYSLKHLVMNANKSMDSFSDINLDGKYLGKACLNASYVSKDSDAIVRKAESPPKAIEKASAAKAEDLGFYEEDVEEAVGKKEKQVNDPMIDIKQLEANLRDQLKKVMLYAIIAVIQSCDKGGD